MERAAYGRLSDVHLSTDVFSIHKPEIQYTEQAFVHSKQSVERKVTDSNSKVGPCAASKFSL